MLKVLHISCAISKLALEQSTHIDRQCFRISIADNDVLNGIRKLISLQFQTSFINNGLPFLQFQLILEFPLVEGKEIFPGFSDESCDTVL